MMQTCLNASIFGHLEINPIEIFYCTRNSPKRITG